MPESDVIHAGPLMTAPVLWIDDAECRVCRGTPTHFVLQPIPTGDLSETRVYDRQFAVLANAFCNEHSPAVQPVPKPKRWWQR